MRAPFAGIVAELKRSRSGLLERGAQLRGADHAHDDPIGPGQVTSEGEAGRDRVDPGAGRGDQKLKTTRLARTHDEENRCARP